MYVPQEHENVSDPAESQVVSTTSPHTIVGTVEVTGVMWLQLRTVLLPNTAKLCPHQRELHLSCSVNLETRTNYN